jgi:hypothetical protein
MKTGEVREDNNTDKIFVTFVKGKSSFYISKSDGSRAGFPDRSTGFASGFNNRYVPPHFTGMAHEVTDPQNFIFMNDAGQLHIYKNTRPVLVCVNGSNVFSEYVYDYAKFNADYSRINVIVDPTDGSQGIFPFGILKYSCPIQDVAAYVFERIQQANVNNQDFY